MCSAHRPGMATADRCRVSSGLAGMMFAWHLLPEILDRARKIKLFLMDVDGTLTDGSVNLISLPGGGGVAEMKAFNSQDGAGLKLAHIMGIRTRLHYGKKISRCIATRPGVERGIRLPGAGNKDGRI